jgi:hypothetical protein
LLAFFLKITQHFFFVIEIINDPIPMIIHHLSRLPVNNSFLYNYFLLIHHFQKDESRKRSIPEDESQVPSFTIDQTKRTKSTTIKFSN